MTGVVCCMVLLWLGSWFAVLAGEEVLSLAGQFQEGIAIDLELMGGDEGLVDGFDQEFAAGVFGQEGVVFLEKAAAAGGGFDDAEAFELGVGLGEGVAVDMEFLGQLADGGERFAWLEGAGGGGIADLIDNLEVNRHAGLEIELEEQRCHLSYDIRTPGGGCQWGKSKFLIALQEEAAGFWWLGGVQAGSPLDN